MRFLSVCSGIEAASVAWNPLGWKAVAFSEIEPFPCAVLAHHYPDVPNWGDMTKYQEWPDATVDLLCGGTPCQSFSVAGLRKGLDDPRGNLMLTFGAIAARYRPRWLVWENVPGVLSSNGGRDFGAFLGMLGQLGYGFAYRVLDAQYFGLAQRRKRVFVVGCLGDWRSAAAVLFERHSMSGHPAPSRQAGKAAPTLPSRSTAGGGLGTDFDCDGGLVAATLDASYGRLEGCSGQDANHGHSHLVPVAFDPTQITSAENRSNPQPGAPCHTLARGMHAPAVAFSIQAGATRENPESGPDGVGVQADHAYTLEARAEVQAVAFAATDYESGAFDQVEQAAPLTTSADRTRAAPVVAWSIMPQNSGRDYKARPVDVLQPLMAGAGQYGNQGGDIIQAAMQVRRLTPRECERLQGFPDDYTRTPLRTYKRRRITATRPADRWEQNADGTWTLYAADGPRYKALGNSWAVPCARWIGERIGAVDAITIPSTSERLAA